MIRSTQKTYKAKTTYNPLKSSTLNIYGDWLSYLQGWKNSIELRRSLLQENPTNSYRLVHTEGNSPLRFDKFGPVGWIYWYGTQADRLQPTFQAEIMNLARSAHCEHLYLRQMINRGKDAQECPPVALTANPPRRWLTKEGPLSFELRSDCGLSPGLFLDQRNNRHWLFQTARQKRVLNLFSYTCSFSAMAATAGAKKVVSVDTSQRYLAWGQQNFTHNGLDASKFDFIRMDVREFLRMAGRQKFLFDIIICDPPSFARSKNGVFRIEDEAPSLIRILATLLAPGGQLLFSSNYEKWSAKSYFGISPEDLGSLGLELSSVPTLPMDFLVNNGQVSLTAHLFYRRN